MANLNQVHFIGNATRDCELRYTKSGTAMGSFSIAIGGRNKDEVMFINCVISGETAEKISQYITKGKSLYVGGRLTQSKWTSDDGQKHERWEVFANQVQLLGGRDE